PLLQDPSTRSRALVMIVFGFKFFPALRAGQTLVQRPHSTQLKRSKRFLSVSSLALPRPKVSAVSSSKFIGSNTAPRRSGVIKAANGRKRIWENFVYGMLATKAIVFAM